MTTLTKAELQQVLAVLETLKTNTAYCMSALQSALRAGRPLRNLSDHQTKGGSMNMSYCRFQNTLADLRHCLEHIDDGDLSDDEEWARDELIRVASSSFHQ